MVSDMNNLPERYFERQAVVFANGWFSVSTYENMKTQDWEALVDYFVLAMEEAEQETKENVNDWFEAPERD
jgi:hypothetical protein